MFKNYSELNDLYNEILNSNDYYLVICNNGDYFYIKNKNNIDYCLNKYLIENKINENTIKILIYNLENVKKDIKLIEKISLILLDNTYQASLKCFIIDNYDNKLKFGCSFLLDTGASLCSINKEEVIFYNSNNNKEDNVQLFEKMLVNKHKSLIKIYDTNNNSFEKEIYSMYFEIDTNNYIKLDVTIGKSSLLGLNYLKYFNLELIGLNGGLLKFKNEYLTKEDKLYQEQFLNYNKSEAINEDLFVKKRKN